MESRRESDYCWVCLWTRASRVVDLPVRPHASFPRLLKLSLILCWHSEAGKPSFKYEHMMEAQDFCTVCVCVSAFFLWCHKTSLLCGSKRAFIRRVKRFLRHSNTGRMFPALIVCDQRFTSNCSEHFELWTLKKKKNHKMIRKRKNGTLKPGHSCRGNHTWRQRDSSVCSVFLLCAHTAVILE